MFNINTRRLVVWSGFFFVTAIFLVTLSGAEAVAPPSVVYSPVSQYAVFPKPTCKKLTDFDTNEGLLVYERSSGNGKDQPFKVVRGVVEDGVCYDAPVSFYFAPVRGSNTQEQINALKEKFDSSGPTNVPGAVPQFYLVSGDYYFTGPEQSIDLDEVLPTAYKFGSGDRASDERNYEGFRAVRSKEFVNARLSYQQLFADTEALLRSCDAHIREEYVYVLGNTHNCPSPEYSNCNPYFLSPKNIVWTTSDGDNDLSKDVPLRPLEPVGEGQPPQVNYTNAGLGRIEAMGCKDAFMRFAQSRTDDFDRFDNLAVAFGKKYPTIAGRPQDYLVKRDPQSLQKIDDFAYGSGQRKRILSELPAEPEISVTIFQRVYPYLPLVGVLGLLIFLRAYRKQPPNVL